MLLSKSTCLKKKKKNKQQLKPKTMHKNNQPAIESNKKTPHPPTHEDLRNKNIWQKYLFM